MPIWYAEIPEPMAAYTRYEMTEQLIRQIEKLKAQRGAVILAHNYQPGEIQDLADFTGDSLALASTSRTDAEMIVFCGVRFGGNRGYSLA
jgi:quinolinate synthase